MVERRDVARLLAGTFLLAGSATIAQAEVRALSLINTHTQERATIVFKRNGAYDQQGLQELNRMLRDWRRNEVTRMDPALFDLVWEVYRKTGADQPIHIVSGYRSPATNNMLRSRSRGVAKLSQHMLGKAMDFYLPDVALSTLRETGMKMQVGGVGFYPTSGSPFVHMDTGSVRAWPRMTRDQLVRLFPDGKTAHLPADGEPLSGYQQAVAEVEARKGRGGGASESSSGGGLLAALFGGGSSSTPSYSAASDDDDEGAAPAPRRQQELRQGPLPPGSSPKVLARGGDTPPGVDTALLPSRPAKPPVQAAPAAETRLAMATPPAPVPTTVAKGSLVAMPVAPTPPARPATAAPEAPASRFAAAPAAPAGNGLPPGWVVGPGAAAPAAEAPVRIAFTPGLKPIAAPLPSARPGAEPQAMVLAAVVGRSAVPVDAPLPRPRPFGPQRLAEAADPHAALSAFAGENDRDGIALGYASPTAAAAPAAVASAPIFDGPVVTASMPPLAATAPQAAPAAPVSRFAALAPSAPTPRPAVAGKADRIAAATARPVAKLDRVDAERLYDAAAGRTDGQGFAQLRHPDQEDVATLLSKPSMTLAGGFTGSAIGGGWGSGRFAGAAVVALPIVRVE